MSRRTLYIVVQAPFQFTVDACKTMAFFSCGPLGLCLPLLLVILLSFPTLHVFAKEDRLPTCEELNEDYDDDTVICNQQDASDYSYDLSKLDPNRAPLRCRDWDRSMVDLDVLDEYYICEKWHKLYGVLRPVMTQAPTVSPTRTPSKYRDVVKDA